MTGTQIPTRIATPDAAFWEKCNSAYKTRLSVGMTAYLGNTPPERNRLRDSPYTDRNIIGYIDVSEKVKIIDGPSCSNHWIWWKVESLKDGEIGWTVEGDKQNYWLVPLP